MGKISKSTVDKVLRPNCSMTELAEEFRIQEAKEFRHLSLTRDRADMWAILLKNKSPILDEWEKLITESVKKEWGSDGTVKFDRLKKIISVENKLNKLSEDIFCV